MLDKEFVPYEESLALNELGFNYKCCGFYQLTEGTFGQEKKLLYPKFRLEQFGNYNKNYPRYLSRPLYQQAFRWFRENYDFVNPTRELIYILDKTTQTDNPMTYEEAELACIRKLIEIVRENQTKNSHK